MAKITFPGMEEYLRQMEGLGREIPKICNRALYDGAKILADAVQKEIDTLDKLDKRDRQGLHDGLGIARFWAEGDDMVTKIGWEGYNSWKTKRWPQGKPNALVARAQIRGTSWIHPNRFTARAAKKARKACMEAMRNRFDQEIEAQTKK